MNSDDFYKNIRTQTYTLRENVYKKVRILQFRHHDRRFRWKISGFDTSNVKIGLKMTEFWKN